MPAVGTCSLPPGHDPGLPGQIAVGAVLLLGVRVTACAVLDGAERQRRVQAGITAVTDPGLLGRLLNLPAGEPVRDAACWAAAAGWPDGIVQRGGDGRSVVRLLRPPLILQDIVVPGARYRELRAVQDASLFAGFARRWVAAARDSLPDAVVLEAKVTGVGLLGPGGRVLLTAEAMAPRLDEWGWLLREKTYRRWLAGRAGSTAPRSRAGRNCQRDGVRIKSAQRPDPP
jgi:hypothetical protein